MARRSLALFVLLMALGTGLVGAQSATNAAAASSSSITALDSLVAELSQRSASVGFVDQVLSAARGRPDIHEALALLKALTPKAPAALRKPLLREQAQLLEFQERWLDAAALWQEAAATPLGAGDLDSLLSAGLCLLLGGDSARSLVVASAARALGGDPAYLDKAQLIAGWASLSTGDRAAAYTEANAVLEAGRKALRLAAFDLAIASGDAEAAALMARRRLSEYPSLGGAAPPPRYAILALAGMAPTWLREEAPAASPTPPLSGPGGATGTSATPGASQKSADDAARPTRFQVGAFKDAANAEASRKRLADKGFSVHISVKKQGADTVSVLYVEAGNDPAKTLLGLKDAGFEAWPLYDQP